jgi:hypothetical protein
MPLRHLLFLPLVLISLSVTPAVGGKLTVGHPFSTCVTQVVGTYIQDECSSFTMIVDAETSDYYFCRAHSLVKRSRANPIPIIEHTVAAECARQGQAFSAKSTYEFDWATPIVDAKVTALSHYELWIVDTTTKKGAACIKVFCGRRSI